MINHNEIEKKWQKIWQNFGINKTATSSNENFYALDMFPYPSGDGLHMGHVRIYTASDVIARYYRLKGKNVLHPMGWDAFGLPAENYAIKHKTHPNVTTKNNIANIKRQFNDLGMSYDWDREINTTDPGYYKWTQWIFLKLLEHGLAYEAETPINWCPSCKTGLANEEVIAGKCERCGTETIRKNMRQWMLRITEYADRLLSDLDELEWPEKIKLMQKNWIGKKHGINITYQIEGVGKAITCFTTRPDTNFGATFVVVGPEHELLKDGESLNIDPITWKEIQRYKDKSVVMSEIDRLEVGREKTGVFTGLYCINNLNDYRMPIYVADYVLGHVGTGAVVGVPAHDKRDFEFAQKFNIPVIRVVEKDGNSSPINNIEDVQEDGGKIINSGFLNGLDIHDATNKIMDYLEEKGLGKRVVNYKLRDWIFSRQRYWGEPIPVIHCQKCAEVKNKVILIHGLNGHVNENWFPWAKHELEKRGYAVLAPTLPNHTNPNIDDWAGALKDLDLSNNDNITIVAHSLGAPAAIKFIEEKGIKIHNLILVAPTGKHQQNINFDNIRKNDVEDVGIDAIKSFNATRFDWHRVKSLTLKTSLFLSNDDPYIPLSVEHDYAELNPEVKVFNNKGHFNRRSNILALPELLHYFPAVFPGIIPVPEKDLPVMLPNLEKYEPTGTGESPLATVDKWVNVKCPVCGAAAKRETNTMPQWAGSCWYYLRYIDPANEKRFAKDDLLKEWLPVDIYMGGAEHAVLHLLYARFWHKFLYDIGQVPTLEPFQRLESVGIVLAKSYKDQKGKYVHISDVLVDGDTAFKKSTGEILTSEVEKMSKSKGNVISPDDLLAKYGADVVRTYMMFLGPWGDMCSFDIAGLEGSSRFLKRVSDVVNRFASRGEPQELSKQKKIVAQSIIKITADIEKFRFNTAVSQLMILLNSLEKDDNVSKVELETFAQLLSPIAPHLAEEMWQMLGNGESIFKSIWPNANAEDALEDEIEVVVQINGKMRGIVKCAPGASKDTILEIVKKDAKISSYILGEIIKEIFVPDKIINLVIKS